MAMGGGSQSVSLLKMCACTLCPIVRRYQPAADVTGSAGQQPRKRKHYVIDAVALGGVSSRRVTDR